jgi:Putative Actinobacterial Holin-X, holin superfamily III
MAAGNGSTPPGSAEKSLGEIVNEVTEKASLLVREEVELAKAEVTQKVSSLARGTVAVFLGAVFGVFALIFLLETAAWGLNAILIPGAGDLWTGFAIVFGVLALLTIIVFLFAWRKLRVGPPTPQMAIDEAKRIRETVATTTQEGS